ncbi:hypothetical protein HPB50_011596 [Hyalomma asiaticum]|uniref:Uncharacterized protein n=1 Tax=Hyalomma asiaticum TaxID=266040 RepID=A0ACB7SVM5_HYAAI|nr:hypothetical protein HPB50_011596 [Hyalomma asiaticum]
MAQQPTSSALRALGLEFKSLQEEPVEGFRVKLVNDDNLFEWEVAIFGPPDTLYEGGYFKAHMKFPPDYPYSPPTVRFLTKVWHPNVYENGDLCISILHPPIDDPQSGELPCERWNPTQNVRTILLSVISLLNEPNTFSPANVDASVMYRRWKDSKGADKEYENIIRKQVSATRLEADRDNVTVPTTIDEYCVKHRQKVTDDSAMSAEADMTDFYDDDYDDDLEDDEEDEEVEEEEDAGRGDGHQVGRRSTGPPHYKDDDDSGNGEKCVADSRLEAEKDGVRIPTTVDDYVVKRQQPKPAETSADLTDIFYDTTDDDTGD